MFYIYYTSSVFEFFFRTPRNRTGTIILGSLLRNQYTFHPFAKQFWDKTDLLFSRLSKAGKRFHLQCRRPQFDSCIWKIPWRRDRLPTPVFMGFPGGSDVEESASNTGDLGSIPGLGRSSEGGTVTHSSIHAWRIPMDRGAWWATVHGVTKSWTWLSD